LITKTEHSINISFPANEIKFAFEEGDENNPWDHEVDDFRRNWKVTNKKLWARNVFAALRHLLLDEEEDGSSKLTKLMDEAFTRAIEDGSNAVEEDGRTHKELSKDGV